jgi:sugar/nucleoside kinase (ribokinase family)
VDVIAFGTIFLEFVFGHVPALPGPGEEVYSGEFAVSCGGGGLTVATAASKSGVHAGLAALLGDDLGSRIATEHCRREGVDLSPSRRVPGRVAGITIVMNFEGDRAFLSYVPPRPGDERPEVERWRQVLREYRPAWCYLHAGAGLSGLLSEARSLGVRIALDLALGDIDSHRDEIVNCVRLADVTLPNGEELMRLTRIGNLNAAIACAAPWARCLVVKRGPQGAIVAGPEGRIEVTEGLRDVDVRDRTGAGDAFAGAFIAAMCKGATTAQAAAAGNRAGSATVSVLGAVGEVEVEGLT